MVVLEASGGGIFLPTGSALAFDRGFWYFWRRTAPFLFFSFVVVVIVVFVFCILTPIFLLLFVSLFSLLLSFDFTGVVCWRPCQRPQPFPHALCIQRGLLEAISAPPIVYCHAHLVQRTSLSVVIVFFDFRWWRSMLEEILAPPAVSPRSLSSV